MIKQQIFWLNIPVDDMILMTINQSLYKTCNVLYYDKKEKDELLSKQISQTTHISKFIVPFLGWTMRNHKQTYIPQLLDSHLDSHVF